MTRHMAARRRAYAGVAAFRARYTNQIRRHSSLKFPSGLWEKF